MTMIADALQDLKNAALSGETLNFAEVAADYGINAKLLERKFHESFPNGVVALETPAEMLQKRIAKRVAEVCNYYGVPESATKVRTVRGITYTVICTIRGAKHYRYSAVSHKDGRAYKITG